MRSYLVRVFIPTVIEIQAEDYAQALAKVGAYYEECYAKDLQDCVESLPEPEDCT
jgi:hypothetical protein